MTEEKFIKTLKSLDLADLILNAENSIIYSSVNLHEEITIALVEAYKKGVDVKVIIDTGEENYRNGFGDIKSIEKLKNASIEIYEVKGNLISFLIADDKGYFIFTQSRIFQDDPSGPNAVLMDSNTLLKITAHYFPPKSLEDKKALIEKAIELQDETETELKEIIKDIETGECDIELKTIDENKLVITKENLKINPPLQPDLKRKINTYTAKIQFVELNFIGSNFRTAKVKIPNNALPFRNTELKKSLETKLHLFEDIKNNHDFEKFNEIKLMVERLRFKPNQPGNQEAFLIPISCRKKSIIRVIYKKQFLTKLEDIKKAIREYKKNTLEELEKEILKRKKTIKNELIEFLKENPPKEYNKYSQATLFDKIEDSVQSIVSKIKFPDVSRLISGLEIKYNFYDLTFEDFRDKKLIKEFREKEILKSEELNEIVDINKAFKAAR